MIAVEPFTPIRAVAKGSADLGLTFHFRSPLRKGIAILGQIQCPMHVVMTPDHELATRSSVTLEECGGYPLIYQEDSGSMGVFFGQEMQNFKELHQPVSISNNLGLMKQLLIGGKGIAFYTRLGFVEELASAARAPHLVAGLQARCLMKINALPVLWVLIERRMERRIGPCLVPATLNPRVWRRQIDRSHLNL